MNTRTSTLRVGEQTYRFGPPKVMGIVNVTTDSFSGDGLGRDSRKAVETGMRMLASGATFVDVGGESTRPGAMQIAVEEEIRRTIGVIRVLSERHPGRISIDTMKAEVADEALRAGASIVNDVNGLRGSGMAEVVAEHDASVVIMHMSGTPRTMQKRPRYKDVVAEIHAFLHDRVDAAERAGVRSNGIMIDPGIGFGKTLAHNLEIIERLDELRSLGRPVVMGVSRKSFIGKLTGAEVDGRLPGSLAAAVIAAERGANILRVHDVPETAQALGVAWGIVRRGGRGR